MHISPANAVEYARRRGLLGRDETPRVEPLSGGVACTVLRLHANRGAIVIKQAQPKFRVAAEWLVDPARNILEAQFQKLAREALGAAHVPDVLDIDEPNFAYTMTSAPLDAQNWKTLLLAGNIRPALGQQCAALLTRLHRIPVDEPRLPAGLRDPKFFYQQRIEPYFEFTAARHPDVREIAGLIEELKKPRCVTHGDYTPKNFLVAGDNLVLLDYEVVHLGAGEFDIASIVNHLTLKMFHLPAHRAALRDTTDAFLDELTRQGVTLPPWWLALLGALLLARVDGKSPAEYLREADKPRIREAAKRLLRGDFADYEAFQAGAF